MKHIKCIQNNFLAEPFPKKLHARLPLANQPPAGPQVISLPEPHQVEVWDPFKMQNFLIPINRCTFYSHREILNIFLECCQGEGPSMSISPRRSRVWSRLLKKVGKGRSSLALSIRIVAKI